MPAVKERRESTLDEKRAKYWCAISNFLKTYSGREAVRQFFDVEDAQRDDFERSTYHQIAIDVPRTNPSVRAFVVCARFMHPWS